MQALVERILNSFEEEKYARKKSEQQTEIRIQEIIKSQTNENNRLHKIITDTHDTLTVQHTEIQRLDAVNKEINIDSDKLKSTVEEISNSVKLDRDEINRLNELVLDLNSSVITQHDEIERVNTKLNKLNTAAISKYEEVDSFKETLRVMTNTIKRMTTSIPSIIIILLLSISFLYRYYIYN